MTAVWGPLLIGLLAAGASADDTPVRPLGDLAREAAAVVLGRVERTTRYDTEGVRLHRLRALRVLSGRLRDPDPDILEIRDGSNGNAPLAVGRRVIVLLRDGPPLSTFGDDLPRIPCFVPVGGAGGVIAVNSDADVEAVEATLATH